jgi:hypothetical protein
MRDSTLARLVILVRLTIAVGSDSMGDIDIEAGFLCLCESCVHTNEEVANAVDPQQARFDDGIRLLQDFFPARRRVELRTFCDDLYQSRPHMMYLHKCKKTKSLERKLQQQNDEHAPLEGAWNTDRLRQGDRVGETPADEQGAHPNQWTSTSVIRTAWKQIGKSSLARVGIDAMRRGLNVLAVVASAFVACQQTFVEEEIEQMCASGGCPYITKFYDNTSVRMKFGRLQAQLMPHARYPLMVDDTWKSVTYDEYVKRHPRSVVMKYGTVEVMAQGLTCVYMSSDSILHGFRPFNCPRVLTKGNASTIYTSTEDENPSFSSRGLAELASRVPYGMVSEIPDACSANKRKIAKSETLMPDNIFFIGGCCGGHQGHRTVATTEKVLIGHIHATYVTCSHTSNQNKMQKELWEIIDMDLDFGFFVGVPDQISVPFLTKDYI